MYSRPQIERPTIGKLYTPICDRTYFSSLENKYMPEVVYFYDQKGKRINYEHLNACLLLVAISRNYIYFEHTNFRFPPRGAAEVNNAVFFIFLFGETIVWTYESKYSPFFDLFKEVNCAQRK